MMGKLVRWLLLALLVAMTFATSGFGPPTLIESEAAATPVSARTLKLMAADRPPVLSAKAAVVMDAATGQVVFEKNARERRAPASTTKMMTALVTLENARLDQVVTASANVVVEPSIIGLEPGDQLTVEQLLYGLMLPSGNDAALALAEHVGGSVARFAEMMNAKAAQLGLRDTHFVNPHGLDARDHYSSAYDLAVIARVAMQNPVFERIVATREQRVEGPVSWIFKNNNRLLGVYPGADGIKTGYTDNAGRCLVFSATRGGHRAISVVLDSAAMYEDSAALLDYFFANYDWRKLSADDNPLSEYGQGDGLRRTSAESEHLIVFPVWQGPYLRWFFSVEPSPNQKGAVEGRAVFYLFGKSVAEIELRDQGG